MKTVLLCWIAASLTLSAASLKFEEMTKEIRADADARSVVADFNFKNETAEDVIIDRYDAACTCINAQLKGDPTDKPSILLTTRVIIPVLVEVEPKTLIWETGEKAAPNTVTLTMKHSEPIRVKAVTGADSRFTQELKVIEEGKKYEVLVTPASTDKVGMGVIHVETDCSVQRHRSHRIFSVVRHALPKPAQAVAKP